MLEHLVDEITTLLRRDRFRRIVRHKSSTSVTLTAEREGVSVILHIAEGAEAPTAVAVPIASPKDVDIKVKATLPGLRATLARTPDMSDLSILQKFRQGAGGSVGKRGTPHA